MPMMFGGIDGMWLLALPGDHWIWTFMRYMGLRRPVPMTEIQRLTFWNLPNPNPE